MFKVVCKGIGIISFESQKRDMMELTTSRRVVKIR